jgi:antitoxin CptB
MTGPMLTELEIRRKQALFRAQRRGFRELDLIFGAFADAHLARLEGDELAAFEDLLSVPDWRIYGWILGEEPTPPQHDTPVFAQLCAYRANLEM